MEKPHRHRDIHVIYIFYAQIHPAVVGKGTEVPIGLFANFRTVISHCSLTEVSIRP